MINPVILVFGIWIALIAYILIYIRVYNNKKIQMIDWFLLSLISLNCLAFVFVLWASDKGYNTLFWKQYINMYDNSAAIIYLISSIILGLSSLIGWKVIKVVRNEMKQKKYEIIEKTIDIKRYIRKIKFIAWFMFILGLISYGLYTKAYGGFLGLLQYSIAIRSGTITINNPFSFLQRFGSFSFISSFIFFGIYIDKSIDKMLKRHSLFGYIITFTFSIYVLYSWAGRVGMLVYIATFILGYILYSYKSVFRLVKKLIVFLITVPFILFGIDGLLNRSSSSTGLIELFAKELSFPFASYIVQLSQSRYRLFKDIIVAPLFLLPQRIWSVLLNIEVASSYNTYIFFGARKGELGVTGSIPVDMLTFSNMQASIIGILIVGLLWGILLYYLELLCKKIYPSGIRQIIYANITLNVAVLTVLYGDPQHIVIRNFALIVGIILIRLVMKFRISYKN